MVFSSRLIPMDSPQEGHFPRTLILSARLAKTPDGIKTEAPKGLGYASEVRRKPLDGDLATCMSQQADLEVEPSVVAVVLVVRTQRRGEPRELDTHKSLLVRLPSPLILTTGAGHLDRNDPLAVKAFQIVIARDVPMLTARLSIIRQLQNVAIREVDLERILLGRVNAGTFNDELGERNYRIFHSKSVHFSPVRLDLGKVHSIPNRIHR